MRQAVIYPGKDGYRAAESPASLPAEARAGHNEEVPENIKVAIGAYIAALQEDGLPVPDERPEVPVVPV